MMCNYPPGVTTGMIPGFRQIDDDYDKWINSDGPIDAAYDWLNSANDNELASLIDKIPVLHDHIIHIWNGMDAIEKEEYENDSEIWFGDDETMADEVMNFFSDEKVMIDFLDFGPFEKASEDAFQASLED